MLWRLVTCAGLESLVEEIATVASLSRNDKLGTVRALGQVAAGGGAEK